MSDAIAPTTTVMLSSPGGSGPVAVTVVSDSAAAAKLLDGALIEGQVQARASKGVLEVVTADGVLQLKAAPGASLPALPAGARLTLQMAGQGSNSQLFVVGINGRPLGGALLTPDLGGLLAPRAGTPAVRGGDGTMMPTPQTAQAGGPGATPAAGTVAPLGQLGLTATIIRPANSGGAIVVPSQQLPGQPPALPADLPPGTRLTVRIAGLEPPPGDDSAAAGAPTQPPSPGQGTAPAATAGLPPRPGLPAGGPTVPAPTPAAALTPSDPAATILRGTVTAQPPSGPAVVQTPIGTLSVPTHANLPVGTGVTLEVVGTPLPPLPAPPPAARSEGLSQLGWPALNEALDTLASANQPQALEQLLRAIPQADGRLAATMVAFTGALRGSTPRALLNDDTVRGLEKSGKKDIAGRIKADLEALLEESQRPLGNGEWRAYTMPMLHGGVVEPVRLFVRRPDGDEGGGKGSRGDKANDHRFVLDFNLTRLGRLQLDGLVRRDDKLFDLIIRTGEPLSPDMRHDILGIFTDASELVGTKGTVSFQAGGRWMEFPPAPPPPTRLEV